jgi:hypothetical protein
VDLGYVKRGILVCLQLARSSSYFKKRFIGITRGKTVRFSFIQPARHSSQNLAPCVYASYSLAQSIGPIMSADCAHGLQFTPCIWLWQCGVPGNESFELRITSIQNGRSFREHNSNPAVKSCKSHVIDSTRLP